MELLTSYRTSPFPYCWNLGAQPIEVQPAFNSRITDVIPPFPPSFKARFYKASIRNLINGRLSEFERTWGPTKIDRQWFDNISNHGERSSFVEHLIHLELQDFHSGFLPWSGSIPSLYTTADMKGSLEKAWYERELDRWAPRHQQGSIFIYPDLSEVEPPDCLKRLVSSKGSPKQLALLEAWPEFRRSWARTARGRVFGFHDSDEALAWLEGWMEARPSSRVVPTSDPRAFTWT